MANRTLQDAVTRVRRVLQDTGALQLRNEDADLLDAVNDALLEVRRIRPDLFLSAVDFTVPDAVLGDEFPIDVQFFLAVVYMAAGHVLLRDDQFSQDARAVALLNKGVAQLQTTGA